MDPRLPDELEKIVSDWMYRHNVSHDMRKRMIEIVLAAPSGAFNRDPYSICRWLYTETMRKAR